MAEFKSVNEKNYPSRILKEACPVCGKELATDGKTVWCINVADVERDGRGCSFGMRETVMLKELVEKVD